MSLRFVEEFRKVSEVLLKPEQRWRGLLLITRKLIDQGQIALAQKRLDRLLELSRKYPLALLPTVRQMRRVGRVSEGLAFTESLWTSAASGSAAVSLACAQVWYDNSMVWKGDIALSQAKELSPRWVPIYVEEAMNQRWRGNVAVATEAAQRVIELIDDPAESREWSLFIGEEYFKIERYSEAAREILKGLPKKPEWRLLYQLAMSLEHSGQEAESEKYYGQAQRRAFGSPLPGLALARLHYRAGYHARVLETLEHEPRSAEADVLRAQALLKLGRYEEVLELSQRGDIRELRALALELLGRWRAAVSEYAPLLECLEQEHPDHARLARRLARAATYAGNYEVAVAAERSALSSMDDLDQIDPEVDPLFTERLASARAVMEGTSNESAVRHLTDLQFAASSPGNIRRVSRQLGNLLGEAGRYEEAARAFLQANPFRLPNTDEADGTPRRLNYSEQYSEALETLPLNADTVVYESFHGVKSSCNPLALCRYMLERDDLKHLHHVWVLKDGGSIHPSLLGRPNVHFVRHGSLGYRLHLATAGVVVNNMTFPHWYLRREGQRYVNTWHGIPWKHMGKDISGDSFSYDNVARNLLQATEVALPDAHTAKVLIETQDVSKLLRREPLLLGSPRIDSTLGMDEESRRQLCRDLGLRADTPKVFYAPTWRGVMSSIESASAPFIEAARKLAEEDVDVILRVHHFMEAELEKADMPSNICVAPDTVDTNELLGLADVLVSDYSSLIFDYCVLNRPIIKYVFDLEEYSEERGLYFSLDEVPGTNCRTLSELADALRTSLRAGAEEIDWTSKPTSYLWANEDGNAAARLCELLMADPRPAVEPEKPVSLISIGGLNPNGITRSLRNLLRTLPNTSDRLQLFISQAPLASAQTQEIAHELHANVDFSLFSGLRNGTRQENLAWGMLNRRCGSFPETRMADISRKMEREARLYFSDTRFPAVIDFDGYGLSHSALLALGFLDSTSTYVVHSEFVREMELKYPRHRSIGALLPNFSHIASVSRSVMEANVVGMAERFGVDTGAHCELPNTMDVDEILRLGAEPLEGDLEEWFSQPGRHAVMAGRLSAEKNYSAALEGVAQTRREGALVRLLIMGDGVQRQSLLDETASLGIQDLVYFAGQRANPFPAIARADALLLTSLHEGQPLVLLEAMMLGTPVIATDIPGTRSVLEDGRYGRLVSPDLDGVCDAFRAVGSGDLPRADFDPDAYQEEAIRAFDGLVSS